MFDINNLFDSSSLPTNSHKWKRSLEDELDDEEDDRVHHRAKRDIPGNPCVSGRERRTIIFYALDADKDVTRELFHDIGG